jgi:hypothetical protein
MRRDCRYRATVSRGEDFFALEEKDMRALEVSVVGEKIEVYAMISACVTLEVSQHCSASSSSYMVCAINIRLAPGHAIGIYI